MKFRKKILVKELEKEIEVILKLLKELDNDILAKIKEIRENYRVEYNFTKYEIDPKLKELEEWLNPPM
jgi:septation ring formation regulator EzrA